MTQEELDAAGEEAAKKYARELGCFPKGFTVAGVNGHTRGWNDAIAHARATPHAEGEELDCGDNSCYFAKNKTGMRTNGGCRCLDKAGIRTRSMVAATIELLPKYLALQSSLDKLTSERDELKKLLGEAVDALGKIHGAFAFSDPYVSGLSERWINAKWRDVASEALAKLRAAGEGKGGGDVQ